jgi:DNA-binding NarL/FixJ family response regulator
MAVHILMVDDHEILREGVRSLLAKLRPEWQICGEAAYGDEAISMVRSLKPDIVVLDISMPKMSGLEACMHMRKMGMKVPVLIFTTHESETLDAEVRRVGAQGYVLKSQAARSLIAAIDEILSGGTFFGEPHDPDPAPGGNPAPPAARHDTRAHVT